MDGSRPSFYALKALIFVLLAACNNDSKWDCDRYADTEKRCVIPSGPTNLDHFRAIVHAICVNGESAPDDPNGMRELTKLEVACSAKTSDCGEYRACARAAWEYIHTIHR
jgi:hypothetical protein